MHRKHLLTLAVVFATLVTAGCSGDDGHDALETSIADEAVTTTTTTATTLPPGPPCFGLVQADELPEGSASVVQDLAEWALEPEPSVGCEVESGVLKVRQDGSGFVIAIVDDCDSFESGDIPPPELQPAVDQSWVCWEIEVTPDGVMMGFQQRLGWEIETS